jgi:hypothetical protein
MNFFSEYLKYRFRFINRYLWFRIVSLNQFTKKPKIFVIVSKVKNNFFLTGIDLFGRILYKSSPGMLGYTGSDRVSKYAWHDTSVDFFGGLIEYCRYFLKKKLKKKQRYLKLYKRRMSSLRLMRLEPNFLKSKKIKKKLYFKFQRISSDFLLNSQYRKNYQRKLKRKFKRIQKRKKYRKNFRTNLRRFFIILKGANSFNLRMLLKGMKQYKKLKIFRVFCGSLVFPKRSFTLCRIKKVRRV